MWARLHEDRIELLHTAVGIDTATIHHSKAIFADWTADELFQHLQIVPAAYVDAPPSRHHVATAEHALAGDGRVEVTRTWEDRTPPAEPAAAPAPVPAVAASVSNSVTNISMSGLELPLMQREADAVLAASVANPAATFARADYVLLATVIGRGVPATGDDSADIKAAAVHIHHEIKRASEALAQSIIQRQQVA